MHVKEEYDLPFESEFDWRTTLFHDLKEYYIKAIVTEISKYKKEDYNLEWKDNESILNQALEDNLPQKIHDQVLKDITQFLIP